MCRPPAASPTTGSRSTRPACRRAWRSENSCERAMDEREPASGEEGDGEPIPLSALQHAVYCLRQAALIHLERLLDRKSVVSGKSVSVRVDLGGRRIIKKKLPTERRVA